jgi:hypothetical protein
LFIELTYFGTSSRFLINKNHIVEVQINPSKKCIIYTTSKERHLVSESYEEVKSLLNIQSENVIL